MRWRSVLFTPGDRPDRVKQAWREGKADVVVADLEDAVAMDRKAEARQAVAAALAEVADAPCRRAVRINAAPKLAALDLAAVRDAGVDLIVVPKAEDRVTIQRIAASLPHGVGLMLIFETARGVLHAESLAACHRVEAVAFGAEDLAADAGMRRSPGNAEVAVPRSLVALAAASARVAAIDMITADLDDEDRFVREAHEARGLGYAGKMCIHPKQADVARTAFSPGADEVAWAQRVMRAADEAGAGLGGVVVVDGQMVDVPLIRQAQRILGDR